jgi:hypothetical protein
MNPSNPGEAASASLTFSFEGVGDKEQTLFKSFVRLLTHRTHQRWSHQPRGGDLLVVADGHAAAAAPAAPTLVLGTVPARRSHYLCLPIHADDLETMLNVLGGLVVARRRGRSGAAAAALQPGERVRLLRWPSATLLTSRDRIRLATLMTGKPMSVADVQRRSGIAEAVCSDFMQDLDRAGVLLRDLPTEPVPLEARPSRAAAAAPGLLARIRSRLGLALTGRP